MELQREMPEVLEPWLEFVHAHEQLMAAVGPDAADMPLRPVAAFAGALVAGLAGGVVDPESGGALVLLPDGSRARVGVAPEERGVNFGMLLDPKQVGAEWVSLVAFRSNHPVAIHVIPSDQLAALNDAIGVPAPAAAKAPPGAMVLSTVLHWNLCFERLTAILCGVTTYYVTAGGLSLEPQPVQLPPHPDARLEEVA